MERPVTALLGPTNTGKTYLAIERMLAHPTGMVGFPLRLLARENYDRVAALKGPEAVALITGEERIVPKRPAYFICTVEAMPLEHRVDFLAVDEVQLAADRERGHVFTSRILSARGQLETWLIGAETIRPLLERLLPDVVFQTRPRLSTLSYSEPKRLGKLPRRSAIVVFSVREVYEVAERIKHERGGAALVFGALSPRTRNAQVGLYQAGDVDHLVATDAIGMGLNLDIDHVVFTGLSKFDGAGPRRLSPAEVGQIAGRAGRHVRDGHFGPTMDLGPFDRRLVDAVESHRFAPLRSIFWRNDALDFFSPLALLSSLEEKPRKPFFVRMRHADDHRALSLLVRDSETMALARGPERVELLWEVCRVPDFQSVMSEAHAELLARIYRFLTGPSGRIPEDFLASHLKDMDRTDGDVEMLLGRIAAIRTWTYISHRSAWVPDARFWQERARAVEDRLSDTLHERLTQRFVDRPGAVIARYDPSELVTSVTPDGEVLVQGLRAGVLEGFRFVPDSSATTGGRGLLAAANRALRGLVGDRVRALETEGDEAFQIGPLARRGDRPPRSGRGSPLAPRGRPLVGPPRPASSGADPPTARGLGRRAPARVPRSTVLAHGVGTRRSGTGARVRPCRGTRVGAPAGRGRTGGRAHPGGPEVPGAARRHPRATHGLTVFLSALLRPDQIRLRARLFAVRHAGPGVSGPQGEPSVPLDTGLPAAFYLACGYQHAGRRAVRVDRLDRAAALAARLSRTGPFVPPRDLASILGCAEAEVSGVLAGIGYVERNGRFEWRRRNRRDARRRA